MIGVLEAAFLDFLTLAVLLGAAASASLWAQARGWRGGVVVLCGAAAASLLLFFRLYALDLPDGRTLASVMQESLSAVVSHQVEAYQKAGLPADRIREYKDYVEGIYLRFFPGSVGALCLFIGLLSYYPLGWLFSRISPRIPVPQPYREFAVPEPLVFVLALAVGLWAYGMKLGAGEVFATWGGSLVVFLAVFYFLEGMGVVSFFFWRWRLRPLFRFFLYALIILSFDMRMLAVLGLLDLWLDFRRLRPQPKDNATA